MTVIVGSTNPIKIEATKRAFEKVWPNKKWKVIGIEIDAGVLSQPKSDQESIKGATNRANGAIKKSKAVFGVGIEGGLCRVDGIWFDTAWIVVVDKNDKKGIGSTINMPTPRSFINQVEKGMEIGEIDDMFFKVKNSKQGDGHFGLMSKNAVTRKDAYVQGVISALVRFIRPDLF